MERMKAIGEFVAVGGASIALGYVVAPTLKIPVLISMVSFGGMGLMFVYQRRTGWGSWPGKGLSWVQRGAFFEHQEGASKSPR